MYVVTCFNSGAKVILYVLVSLSKCLFFCQSVRWFAVVLKWHITFFGFIFLRYSNLVLILCVRIAQIHFYSFDDNSYKKS